MTMICCYFHYLYKTLGGVCNTTTSRVSQSDLDSRVWPDVVTHDISHRDTTIKPLHARVLALEIVLNIV